MLTEVSSLEKAHREDIFQRWSEVFQLCQTMVIQGIDEGTIGDVDPAVITLAVFSIIQWFPVWLNRKHTANIKEVVASVMDIMINGISAQSHQFEQILSPKVSHKSVDSFDREAQKQAKREAFYRVGSIHFNQKGYKGTSLDEIAGSLQVTKGAFYYHIKNKEELLYQCFERTLSIERILLEQADNSAHLGLEKVGNALHYLVNIQLSDDGPLIRYRSLPSLDEPHRKLVLKSSKRNSDNLGAYIRQGFDDGTLRNINAEIAQHILSGAIEASPDLMEWVNNTNGKQVSKDYLSIFINGLAI
jgi:AcrR family transcriptional regulator